MVTFGPDAECVLPAPGEIWSGTAGALRTRMPADKARIRAIRHRFEAGYRNCPGPSPIGRFNEFGIALPRCPDSMPVLLAERNFRGRLRMLLAGIRCGARTPQGGRCLASDRMPHRNWRHTGGQDAVCPLAFLPSRTDSLDVAMRSGNGNVAVSRISLMRRFGESDGPQRACRIRLRKDPGAFRTGTLPTSTRSSEFRVGILGVAIHSDDLARNEAGSIRCEKDRHRRDVPRSDETAHR